MAGSTGAPPDAPLAAMPPPGTIARALLRAAGSTAVLVVIYFLLPLDHSARWLAITMLAVGLAALVGLISFQVRAIIASRYPGLRALEALATGVPLFVLLFASTYIVMASMSAGSFSQPLTRINALYFAVTVFATVGFGDITPMTEAARLVVTVQMLIDLVILGLGARVIFGAVSRGRQRQLRNNGTAPPGR